MTAATARWSDLQSRVQYAVLFGTLALFATYYDPVSFAVMCVLAALVLWREWFNLIRNRHAIFIPLGLFYIAFSSYSLVAIRFIYGWEAVYLLFALVWSGDIASYFVGKKFGKRKIAPNTSPGKTWEGFAGGVLATIAVSTWALSVANHYEPILDSVLIGIAFAVVGLLGDLFESSLKRKAGVKDSGRLMPGHGGLFDRVDALLPCAILAAILLFY